MGQPPDARLTPELAKGLCERTASSAVLDGSIASLGSQYVLGLRAKNCRTGDVLDEEQVQAARKEDVLNALSQVASRFRTRVGESLATVGKHDRPLEEATTPSLDALKAYSAASRMLSAGTDLAAAVPLLKRAIETDSEVRDGHASLGFIYGLMGTTAALRESNSGRTSCGIASAIRAILHHAVLRTAGDGKPGKSAQTCELWGRTYPRHPSVRSWERCVSDLRQIRQGDPPPRENDRDRSGFSCRLFAAGVQQSVSRAV